MTVYRQLTYKLRWRAADGTDRESERPQRKTREGMVWLDLPPNAPTLVEFAPGDAVDEADLLKMGAIARHEPLQEGGVKHG